METRRLADVFKKLSLPTGLVNKFATAEVHGISLSEREKKMRIDLRMSNLVNESLVYELQDRLQTCFPLMNVDIKLRYDLSDGDIKNTLSSYWDSVLFAVERQSLLCCNILREASWELNDGTLLVKLKAKAAFIFKARKLDRIIQSLIEHRFGAALRVDFVDDLDKSKIVKVDDGLFFVQKPEGMAGNAGLVPSSAGYESASSSAADSFAPNSYEFTQDAAPFAPAPSAQNVVPFTPSRPAGDSPWKNSKGGKGRIKVKINEKLLDELKNGEPVKLSDDIQQDSDILAAGRILSTETRELKNERLLIIFDMTDGSNSITAKFFVRPDLYNNEFKSLITVGGNVVVKGKTVFDEYSKELTIMVSQLCKGEAELKKADNAEQKRVELHLHTQMSAMDAVSSATDYIKRAISWGHKAIAITDHGVLQAYPEAMKAGKDIKIIYGVEAYLADDLGAIVRSPKDRTLADEFVVFDIETTGLSKDQHRIIEIGAVKIIDGAIGDRFCTFVDPLTDIPPEITKLTGITGDMVKGAPEIAAAFDDFAAFAGDAVLVAHNASFDVGFMQAAATRLGRELNNTVLDTLELSRAMFPELNKHKLNIVAEHLGVSLENHHRAVDDAAATAEIFVKCAAMLRDKGVNTLQDINIFASASSDKLKLKSHHAVILVKNKTGLRNLYELVSNAHIKHFYKKPQILKSEFMKLRDGLIIGTACEAGEFYAAVKDNMPDDYIRELAEFYDYFEIQPIGNNMYMLREGHVKSVADLQDINKKIVSLGEKFGKPVVATCDVHFLDPEDEVYRRIIMAGEGFKDADNQAPLFFRTTEEMLAEFEYLGAEKAFEVCVTNTNLIADMIESIKPIPDGTYPPFIEGSEELLTSLSMATAKNLYGDPLPPIVATRLERELGSIIKNGFAVMYILAQKLVRKSMDNGYLVGSRGSVGSSLVATMAGITEVNPLPPHYLCKNCHFSDFDSDVVKGFSPGGCGYDMPERDCPNCGTPLHRDGHDIPFETFLGFDCDKEPDIDLNFSGEYQLSAHAYAEELLGQENVFKAGTIATLADKTAYGFVKNYLEDRKVAARAAEINRLKIGCTGVRRTTGQHPGGLIVVPKGRSIYEFCPIQRPANDANSNVVTTHFDYHSMEGRLLKLDLLGHDVPTIIKMLHDITGIDPTTVSLSDKRVMSLFTSCEAMGVKPEDINCRTGTLGLPEFGTSFVRQMLLETNPGTFSELVRISGLSHGTDVWYNNAQELIQNKTATLKEIIPARDEIMIYLISMGVEKKTAFKIMENVRKGRGLTDAEIEMMEEADVPDWYIESCRKIKYLFPKGHAVAYVIMTVRIGYFKLYEPYSFYAASFSVKAEEFDYETMCRGRDVAKVEFDRIVALGKEATAKEKNTLTLLELVMEMYARGLKFVPLSIYEADSKKFRVTPDGLMPPLCSVAGLGASVATNIVEARAEGEFFTIQEFRERTKTNKTVIELLRKNGVLDGIPETSQLSLV